MGIFFLTGKKANQQKWCNKKEFERALFHTGYLLLKLERNKEYFHIKDLEDGDFIGIDERKVVYKITHDPMEVKALDKKIMDVLKE